MILALVLILVPALILGVIYWLSGDYMRGFIREMGSMLVIFACICLFALGLWLLVPAIFHS